MADHYYGSIIIGGALSTELLPDFIRLLQGAGSDDISSVDMPKEVEDCIAQGRSFELSSCEARYGHFEEVEIFCKDNGLPFRAAANSYCEYPADVTHYDGSVVRSATTDSEECTTVPRGSLDEYINVIMELAGDASKIPLYVNSNSIFYKGVSAAILKTGLTDGLAILKEILSERFPDLSNAYVPPLTLVE